MVPQKSMLFLSYEWECTDEQYDVQVALPHDPRSNQEIALRVLR